MSKYYVPKPKVEIECKKCKKVFAGMRSQQFCSHKCRFQFNERKFREGAFTQKHTKEIWKILLDKCTNCPKEANEIHHKTYIIPIRRINYDKRKKHNKVTKEDVHNMLKEYCKYLSPLCSGCHRTLHLFPNR